MENVTRITGYRIAWRGVGGGGKWPVLSGKMGRFWRDRVLGGEAGGWGILTSELFGLRSDLDLATLQLLDEKRELASKDQLTGDEKTRLAELRDQTDSIDSSGRVSDPLVSEVVKALASTPEFRATRTAVLSQEQRDKRRNLALEAIREVRAEKEPEE